MKKSSVKTEKKIKVQNKKTDFNAIKNAKKQADLQKILESILVLQKKSFQNA